MEIENYQEDMVIGESVSLYRSKKRSFRNHNLKIQAFTKMKAMREKNLLCDVTLEVNDGGFIHTHKMVLASCSLYFYLMFTSFKERDQSRVKLHGIDLPTLELLVNYFYTSEIYITEENVQVLLPAACLFQLTEVHDACCDFLRTQLHPSNCLGIRAFADIFGCLKLREHADSYIDQHFSKVIEWDEFLTLAPEQVIRLISSDRLTVHSEEKVFESVISWINANRDVRQNCVGQLMEHVRLPLLSEEYLTQRVKDEPLIRANMQCQVLSNEALEYHRSKNRDTLFESPRTRPRCGLWKVLLIVGGWSPNLSRTIIECLDFKDEKWYRVSEFPRERFFTGLSVLDGRVYVIGGTKCTRPTRKVDIYDVSADRWSGGMRMHMCRSSHGVAVLGNCIYAVGGGDEEDDLDTAEKYDPYTKKWQLISSMAEKRNYVGVGVVNGLLYAVGGYDRQLKDLSSVECYDPDEDEWESVAEMSTPRCGAGVGVIDGILYAVGGAAGRLSLRSAEAYDPERNQWTPIADMKFCRRYSRVVTFDGLLYVVGGQDEELINLASVEVYSPETNSWTTLPHSMSIGKSHVGAAIIDKPLGLM